MIEFELKIVEFLNSLPGQGFWAFMTKLGDAGAFWIVLTIVLTLYKPTRKLGFVCFFALLMSLILTNGLIKNLVQRPRPFYYTDVKLFIEAPSGYSFPSGHTSASFAIAFSLIREKLSFKGIRVDLIFTVLALLITISRVFLFVHFPSDILVGILMGLVCSIVAKYIVEFIEKRIIKA